MKPCTFCNSPAAVSVCVIVSTLGRTPRLQRNTESVPACKACLSLARAWDGDAGSTGIKERVNNAADALTRQSTEQSQPTSEQANVNETNNEARGSAPAFLSLPIGE